MSVAQPPSPQLQMRGITKRFPGVVANDRIDLDKKAREIGLLMATGGQAPAKGPPTDTSVRGGTSC